MRTRSVAVVGVTCVVVATLYALRRDEEVSRAGRPDAPRRDGDESVGTRAEATTSNAQGAKQRPPVSEVTAVDGDSVADAAWRPESLEVRGWGAFLVEIIGSQEEGQSIVVVQGQRAPHFYVHLAPADGTRYAEALEDRLLGELVWELSRPLDGVAMRRCGPSSVVSRMYEGKEGLGAIQVSVLPYEVVGTAGWSGTTRVKLGLRGRTVEGWHRPLVVAKDLVLRSILTSVHIEPAPARAGDRVIDTTTASFGVFGVSFHGLQGIREASIEVFKDGVPLPIQVVDTMLTGEGVRKPTVPSEQHIKSGTVFLKAMVESGWYSEHSVYHGTARIVNSNGAEHVLQWREDFR